MTKQIFIRDKLYIPASLINSTNIKSAYEKFVYHQNICNRCPIFQNDERHSVVCETCDAGFVGFFKTWTTKKINSQKYYAVPSGDTALIKKALHIDVEEGLKTGKIIDKRARAAAEYPLTFTGKLYTGKEIVGGKPTTNQVRLVKTFWQTKRGIIKSPPRSGKTQMAVRLICAYKRRVLIVAHERELLRQFIRTLRKFTNITQLEKLHHTKIAGIIQYPSDWNENWDICAVPYQQFIHKKTGYKRLKQHVLGKFEVMIIDEIHKSAAECYSIFANNVDVTYKVGLTATTERKDQLDFISRQVIGPVTAESKTTALQPRIEIFETNIGNNNKFSGQAGYVYANNFLAYNKDRNRLIVRQIFDDLRKNNNHYIAVPVLRVKQAVELTRMINVQAGINNRKRGEKWPKQLAVAYYRGVNEKQILETIRYSKETRVVIAIQKKIAEGTDIPRLTHIYIQFPINNPTNFYQLCQRIATPVDNKPQPVIRLFVDQLGLSIGCLRGTFFNSILKKSDFYMTYEEKAKVFKLLDDYKNGVSKTNVKSTW